MSWYCDIAPGHPWHGPYHDQEYGFPVSDDRVLFERLVLEINQADTNVILELTRSQGSFAAWLSTHHPRDKPDWVRLFRKTFRFTGGEITGEFLMSIGLLPGAHRPGCPVLREIGKAAGYCANVGQAV